jgi:peptide/nickel transport system ATP-binding protein
MSAAPTTASEELGGAAAAPALEVKNLEVDYRVRGIWREVLRGISFSIERGTSYGLVGESGCGKSTAALAIVQYLPRNGRVRSGENRIAGRYVVSLKLYLKHIS